MGYWEQRGAKGGDASGQVIVYTDDQNKSIYPGEEGYQLISAEGYQELVSSPSGVVHDYDYPPAIPADPADPSVAGAGDESQVEADPGVHEKTVVFQVPADEVAQVQESAPNLQVIEGEQQ